MKNLYVSPASVQHNCADLRGRHSKLLGEVPSKAASSRQNGPSIPDLANGRRVKFGHSVTFASGRVLGIKSRPMTIGLSLPVLVNHVVGIVFGRPETQVIWADACPIVAPMHHEESLRNGAIHRLPSPPMSTNSFSLGTFAKYAVSAPVQRTGPLPTRAEVGVVTGRWSILINEAPESDFRWCTQGKSLPRSSRLSKGISIIPGMGQKAFSAAATACMSIVPGKAT